VRLFHQYISFCLFFTVRLVRNIHAEVSRWRKDKNRVQVYPNNITWRYRGRVEVWLCASQVSVKCSQTQDWTTKYMYFNHLWLIRSTKAVGDRPPRNICQELAIAALPSNQFTVPPWKTKQRNWHCQTGISRLTPYPLLRSHTQLFILFILFVFE